MDSKDFNLMKKLTICLMNSEEQPLKRETSLIYGSYNFCEICQKETTCCRTHD